jgi:hypothetical protein
MGLFLAKKECFPPPTTFRTLLIVHESGTYRPAA